MRRGHAALIASEGPYDEINALEGRSALTSRSTYDDRKSKPPRLNCGSRWPGSSAAKVTATVTHRDLIGLGPASSESAQHWAADRGLGGPGPLAWTVTPDASQLGRPRQAAQRVEVAGRVGLVHGVLEAGSASCAYAVRGVQSTAAATEGGLPVDHPSHRQARNLDRDGQGGADPRARPRRPRPADRPGVRSRPRERNGPIAAPRPGAVDPKADERTPEGSQHRARDSAVTSRLPCRLRRRL